MNTYTLLICIDCTMAHANGDFSGMDEATEAAVIAGMERTGHLAVGDDYGFSWSACHACGSHLGGDRFEATKV
jgi:hypothetical protein